MIRTPTDCQRHLARTVVDHSSAAACRSGDIAVLATSAKARDAIFRVYAAALGSQRKFRGAPRLFRGARGGSVALRFFCGDLRFSCGGLGNFSGGLRFFRGGLGNSCGGLRFSRGDVGISSVGQEFSLWGPEMFRSVL